MDEELDILSKLGYVLRKEIEIPETCDYTGEKLYPDLKSLNSCMEGIGTHLGTVILISHSTNEQKSLARILTLD